MTTCNHTLIPITLNLGYSGPIDDLILNYSTNKDGEDLLQTFRKQKQQLSTTLQLIQAISSTLKAFTLADTNKSNSISLEIISSEAIKLIANRRLITELVARLKDIENTSANANQYQVNWQCEACLADKKSLLYEPGDFDSRHYSNVWTNSKVHKLLSIEELFFIFKSDIAISIDSNIQSEFDSGILHIEYEFKGNIDYHVLNLMFSEFETVNQELSYKLSVIHSQKVHPRQVKILRIAYPIIKPYTFRL